MNDIQVRVYKDANAASDNCNIPPQQQQPSPRPFEAVVEDVVVPVISPPSYSSATSSANNVPITITAIVNDHDNLTNNGANSASASASEDNNVPQVKISNL